MLLSHGFRSVIDAPQSVYYQQIKKLKALTAKIVDGILVTGETHVADQLLKSIDIKIKFGTVVHRPGMLRHFGFNIAHHEYVTCTIDGDNKLGALEPAILTHLCRKDVSDSVNELERSTFASLSSSFGWRGTSVFPFCAAAASRLLQCLLSVHIADLIKQRAISGELKQLETFHSFRRPCDNQKYSDPVLAFHDAGRPLDSA